MDAPRDSVELVIDSRPRPVDHFTVRRVLPAPARRLVGPFIFYDHFGPVTFAPGQGVDVRPHPHIALATITYLFEGELVHRDSLGSRQVICAGDVNWMLAGRGIVHSERSPPEQRRGGARMHGLQTWVALPSRYEETAPHFEHHAQASIPVVKRKGAVLTVIAGTAYGARSPVGVLSPTLYVHARLDPGATLPIDDGHQERAAYVVDGKIASGGRTFEAGAMVVFRPGTPASLAAVGPASVTLVGGAPLDGPRHVWWNFVASSKERIERAKADWREGRFAKVPGDEVEFIPLPDDT